MDTQRNGYGAEHELALLYEKARQIAVSMIGPPSDEEEAAQLGEILHKVTPMQAIEELEKCIADLKDRLYK